MARTASTISRIRAAGRLHSIENRLVMCGLIWLPSPSTNRPCDSACRSQPMLASSIGLRANATAMAVPSSMLAVSGAATASGRNGSWGPSTVHAPEYPDSSSSAARRPASAIGQVSTASTFTAPTVLRPDDTAQGMGSSRPACHTPMG